MLKLSQEYIEQIKHLYVDKNLSKKEICNELNITPSRLRYILKRNNINKTKEQSIKCKQRVLIEKYGTDVPLKNKKCLDKMKQTNLKKYGTENVMQNKNVQQKVIQTNLKKYGVKYGLQNEEIKNKSKQTNLKKYGVEYTLQSKIIKEKIKKTNLKKYNCENVMQNKDIQLKLHKTNLKKYGSITPFGNKDIQDKIRKTNLKKYGVGCVLKSDIIRNKIKQTNLKKYGNVSPFGNKDIQNKTKQTNLKRYGVENFLNNNDNRNRIEQTNLKKYGNVSPFGNKDIQNKINTTNLQKYGTKYPLQNKNIRNKCTITNINKNCEHYKLLRNKNKLREFLLKISDKDRNTQYCANKLNLNVSTLDKWINFHNLRLEMNFSNNRSHYETDIIEWLRTFYKGNILTNYKGFSKYEIDIYIPEFNLGIEFNGTYWHSNLKVNKNYHYEKSLFFENLGIRLIHIFEYEWNNERQNPILKNIIKNVMQCSTNKIYARECKIIVKKSKEMREFFDKNNIQGFRGRSVCHLFRI